MAKKPNENKVKIQGDNIKVTAPEINIEGDIKVDETENKEGNFTIGEGEISATLEVNAPFISCNPFTGSMNKTLEGDIDTENDSVFASEIPKEVMALIKVELSEKQKEEINALMEEARSMAISTVAAIPLIKELEDSINSLVIEAKNLKGREAEDCLRKFAELNKLLVNFSELKTNLSRLHTNSIQELPIIERIKSEIFGIQQGD